MALLEVRDLHTYFTTKRGLVKAVFGVSYAIEAGRTLGIVGESGSGKSVSAMSILKLLDGNGYIASGKIFFEGQDLTELSVKEITKIRGNKISVIFQEPMTSLNPVFKVEKQIGESFMVHQGMDKKQAHAEAVKMLADVQIPNPEKVAKQYPFQLSGGMRQRVMIAMALACRPKVLIADEPTTALDVTVQAQVLQLMKNLRNQYGTAMIMITHDLGIVADICDKVAIMYAGSVVEYADKRELYKNPKHPYTIGLFNSLPDIKKDEATLKPIKGLMPDPRDLPSGCPFHPRCDLAKPECSTRIPTNVKVGEGHVAKCLLFEGGPASKG